MNHTETVHYHIWQYENGAWKTVQQPLVNPDAEEIAARFGFGCAVRYWCGSAPDYSVTVHQRREQNQAKLLAAAMTSSIVNKIDDDYFIVVTLGNKKDLIACNGLPNLLQILRELMPLL